MTIIMEGLRTGSRAPMPPGGRVIYIYIYIYIYIISLMHHICVYIYIYYVYIYIYTVTHMQVIHILGRVYIPAKRYAQVIHIALILQTSCS